MEATLFFNPRSLTDPFVWRWYVVIVDTRRALYTDAFARSWGEALTKAGDFYTLAGG